MHKKSLFIQHEEPIRMQIKSPPAISQMPTFPYGVPYCRLVIWQWRDRIPLFWDQFALHCTGIQVLLQKYDLLFVLRHPRDKMCFIEQPMVGQLAKLSPLRHFARFRSCHTKKPHFLLILVNLLASQLYVFQHRPHAPSFSTALLVRFRVYL